MENQSLANIVFPVLSILFLLLTAYGALKQNRRNFLLGVFLFSLLPVVAGYNWYANTGDPAGLIQVMAFGSIAIITFPVKIQYGSDNVAATMIARKNALAVIFAFLFNAVLILNLYDVFPARAGYFNIAMALIVMYVAVRSKMQKDFSWK